MQSLNLAVPGQIGDPVKGALQLAHPLGGQQRDRFERRQAVEQRLRGEDELPQILRQRHDVSAARGSSGDQQGAHPLFGRHNLQQRRRDGELQLLPLGVEQARMVGERCPDIPGQAPHHPRQGAYHRPVVLVEQRRILGGEQGGIDPAARRPLPLGAELLDLALQLGAIGVEQPHQPLLRLANATGAAQPLQPVEPAGGGGPLLLAGIFIFRVIIGIAAAQLA